MQEMRASEKMGAKNGNKTKITTPKYYLGVRNWKIKKEGQMIVFFAFLIYLIAVRWLDLHYELRRLATKPKDKSDVQPSAIGFEIPDEEE